jgi:hypothetical protein
MQMLLPQSGISMTAHFFTPSAPHPYFLVAYPHVIDGLGIPASAGMTMLGAPVLNIVIPAKAGIHRPDPCYCLLPRH